MIQSWPRLSSVTFLVSVSLSSKPSPHLQIVASPNAPGLPRSLVPHPSLPGPCHPGLPKAFREGQFPSEACQTPTSPKPDSPDALCQQSLPSSVPTAAASPTVTEGCRVALSRAKPRKDGSCMFSLQLPARTFPRMFRILGEP